MKKLLIILVDILILIAFNSCAVEKVIEKEKKYTIGKRTVIRYVSVGKDNIIPRDTIINNLRYW